MNNTLSENKRASNLLSPRIPWSPEGLSSHPSPTHHPKNITTSGLPSFLFGYLSGKTIISGITIAIIIGLLHICTISPLHAEIDSFVTADSVSADTTSSAKPHWDRDLKFTSEIDKRSLPQNDTLEFRAIIELLGNPMEYNFDDIEPPKVSNLDLISSSSSNKTKVVDGENHYFRIYLFKYIPKTMGMAYINPAALTLEHRPSGAKKVLRTSRLEVDVQEPVLPKDYSKVIIISAIILGIVLILILTYIFLSRLRKDGEEIEVEVLPLETEYLQKIREKRELLQKGDLDGFFSALPPIMREYLGRKFGFRAKGMPTKELISQLESAGMGGKDLEQLKRSFEICDRVRFAREDVGENAAQDVFAGFVRILESFEPNLESFEPKADFDQKADKE